MSPGAYFLTWATYGTRLVEGLEPREARRVARRLKEPVYEMDAEARAVVERAILWTATEWEWQIVAHDVQPTWVHVVVYAPEFTPAQAAGEMKYWATRFLRKARLIEGRANVWTKRPTLCRIADEPTMTPAAEFVAERAAEPPIGLPPLISTEDLEVVRRFARALDTEDYHTARVLLDPACVYLLRGETIEGADAIIESYRGHGDEAAQRFDSITYTSEIRIGTGMDAGWGVIRFADHIEHAVGGRGVVGETPMTCDFVSEQRVKVGHGRIVRLEHRDLPGQRESLARFKAEAGVGG